MRGTFTFLMVFVGLAQLPQPALPASLPFLTHADIGYGRCLDDDAPGGAIGGAIGIIRLLDHRPVGLGLDLGYVNLGTESHTHRLPGGRTDTRNERWFIAPVTGQAYWFLPTAEKARFYLDAGLGYYDVARADLERQSGNPSLPEDPKSEGVLGMNGGVGWMSDRPQATFAYGFDLKVHTAWTEGESTEIVALFGRIYFR